ncbi:Hypothetical protein NTJ_04418 [Nesidiocoris tenuis]|uniref:Uncharacterized protein n=1 Tax=Nesidiocoris tenuis TaxID=355587 RepID=A0ABN7AH67_9HEMI|nr:Hypothetical protein NTJ_04418 [Nesidiocoris tenuis]
MIPHYRIATYLGQDAKNVNAATCSRILNELYTGSFGSCKDEADKYRVECKKLFKLSTVFDIDEVKKERQEDLVRILEIRNEK